MHFVVFQRFSIQEYNMSCSTCCCDDTPCAFCGKRLVVEFLNLTWPPVVYDDDETMTTKIINTTTMSSPCSACKHSTEIRKVHKETQIRSSWRTPEDDCRVGSIASLSSMPLTEVSSVIVPARTESGSQFPPTPSISPCRRPQQSCGFGLPPSASTIRSRYFHRLGLMAQQYQQPEHKPIRKASSGCAKRTQLHSCLKKVSSISSLVVEDESFQSTGSTICVTSCSNRSSQVSPSLMTRFSSDVTVHMIPSHRDMSEQTKRDLWLYPREIIRNFCFDNDNRFHNHDKSDCSTYPVENTRLVNAQYSMHRHFVLIMAARQRW